MSGESDLLCPVDPEPPVSKDGRTPRVLRDYQVEAADAVEGQWREGFERTSVVLPTGTGKSSVIAEVARRAVRRGQRVLALAHRDELLKQMCDTFSILAPDLEPGGIVKAEVDEPEKDFVCASFQTLAASPERLMALGIRDVILVDECHHALAPSYLGVLHDLGLNVDKPRKRKTDKDSDNGVFSDHIQRIGGKNRKKSDYMTQFDHVPLPRACGFTATMSRSDTEQLGKVWSTVAYEKDIEWAIENGFLVKPTSLTVHVPELKGLGSVKQTAGDFNGKQLAEVMESSVESTVRAVQDHCADKNMIVFAASVKHANQLAEALTAVGIPAGAVVGSHTRDEREETYRQFNEGEIKALVTVMVLTEGADFPRCDAVVMARPTRSHVLFCQMVGRALRLYTDPVTGEEKDTALVLDLSGSAADQRLITLTDLWPDADGEEYGEDGKKIEKKEETDGDATERETQQRRGKIDLTAIDLLRKAADTQKKKKIPPHRRIVTLATHDGVIFIPSSRGGGGIMLWPPNPNSSPEVCVIQYTNYGREAYPMIDKDGHIITGDFASMFDTACLAAYQGKDTTGHRTAIMKKAQWRADNRKPSEKQLAVAKKVGATIVKGASMAEVSDAISRKFMDINISNMRPLLRQWGLLG